jgi:hypothetical protein
MIPAPPSGRQHLLHQQVAIHKSAYANVLKVILDISGLLGTCLWDV